MDFKKRSTLTAWLGGLGCFSALLFGAGQLVTTSGTPAKASDHVDSPTVAQDVAEDLGDMWAFLDPNDNNFVILILDTKGFIVSSEHFGQVIYDDRTRYRFEIENTGDARPDRFVDVYYSKGVGRLTNQTATIVLPGGRTFTAPTTVATQDDVAPPPVVTTDAVSGVSFYAGAAADPFFLDDTGANRFVASSLKNPGNPDKTLLGQRGRDTYAGFNQLITAVRVPVALLKGAGNVIGFNAVTQRKRIQLVQTNGEVVGSGPWITMDRDGVPLVNNGLIPAARKNEYNGASTQDDANGRFRADIIKSLNNFGTDAAHQTTILNMVQANGEILRLDVTVPNTGTGGGTNAAGGFGNMGGRRLQDDVVDATFTLINNGVPLGDNVPGKRFAFRNAFPFVADPYQPFPPGDDPEDGTRQ